MHDARYRQLPLTTAFSFLISAFLPVYVWAEGTAAGELQALQSRAKALGGRKSSRGDWKRLGAAYADLAKKYPRDVAILDAHGDFLWGVNDRDGALREWLAAEKLDSRNVAVLNHLAGAYLATGDVRHSFDRYLRVCEVEPANPLAHFNTANVACVFRHDLGKTADEALKLALRHFAEAHRLAPENAELTRAYAETFYLVPDPDWRTALMVWKAHLSLVSEKNFTFLNLARVHMKLWQPDEARACLRQVQGAENQRLKDRLEARIDAELSSRRGPENSPKPVIDGPHALP